MLADKLAQLLDGVEHELTVHPENAGRKVTLICGCPGSGKSTIAYQIHPTALDVGELPPGTPRERMRTFGRRAWKAGRNPAADVAVVQGAPTLERREQLAAQCKPWATLVLLTPPDVCHERVDQRDRNGPDGRDVAGQHAAIDAWWSAWADDNSRQG